MRLWHDRNKSFTHLQLVELQTDERKRKAWYRHAFNVLLHASGDENMEG